MSASLKNNNKMDHITPKIKFVILLIGTYILFIRWFHRFIKPKPKKIKLHGKEFIISGNLEYILFWSINYEKNTYKIFDKFLDKNHSYIDIGAFIGAFVLYGAYLSKEVYGFEPDPIAFNELKKNVSLNPSLKEKIRLYQQCINYETGKVKMGNIGRGGDSTSSLHYSDSKNSWIVDGITFEEFIKENNVTDCNFVKMDIEGGEIIILPTMKDFLKKEKPTLYLSMHPIFFKNPEDDTKKIMEILSIYKNIYTDDGKKIDLNYLLSNKKLKKRYAIIATDLEY
jgi:FkbM family methyltransferase